MTAPRITVWLAQPGARSDGAVEKLTELGVARIGALRCRLLKGEFTDSRIDRWRAGRRGGRKAVQAGRRARAILAPADYADVLSPEAVVLSHTGASGGLADRIVGRRSGDAPDRPGAGLLG